MNQREIKFRVWDNIRLRFLENSAFSLRFGNNNDFRGCHNEFNEIGNPILQQYTGLKDTNDKEIYEGDIVLDTISKRIAIVTYIRGRWVTNIPRQYYEGHELWITVGRLKIIGNIYENPELLK